MKITIRAKVHMATDSVREADVTLSVNDPYGTLTLTGPIIDVAPTVDATTLAVSQTVAELRKQASWVVQQIMRLSDEQYLLRSNWIQDTKGELTAALETAYMQGALDTPKRTGKG